MPRVPFTQGTTPAQEQVILERQKAAAKQRAEQHQQSVDNAVRDLDIPAMEDLWTTEVSWACHRDGPSFGGLRNLEKLTTAAAACCAAAGLGHQHLSKFRLLVKELKGPGSFDRYAFGYNASVTQIRLGAAAELGVLRLLHETTSIRLTRAKADSAPTLAAPATDSPPAGQPSLPVVRLGHGGPGKTFDALCECIRKAQPGQELRAGCRVALAQAKAACAAEGKANDYLSPKGRLCTGGWIRREGKVIELTEKGVDEAANRAAKRMEKRGRETGSDG